MPGKPKDWTKIAPCDVCRFNEKGHCVYQGKQCKNVNICGFAAQALREAGYKNV